MEGGFGFESVSFWDAVEDCGDETRVDVNCGGDDEHKDGVGLCLCTVVNAVNDVCVVDAFDNDGVGGDRARIVIRLFSVLFISSPAPCFASERANVHAGERFFTADAVAAAVAATVESER